MHTDKKIDVPFRTQQFVILAAQAGSFHKAARSLGVDPSVLSRSVDRLESDLDAKIFQRDRRRFVFFLREIQKAVAHVERACDLVRYHHRIQQGPLRIGYSAYAHSRLVPILEQLNLSPAPDNKRSGVPEPTLIETGIRLQSGTTLQLVDAVLRGELHLAFGVQPCFDEDLWSQPICRESFCLCVSKNHRLAKQPSVYAREVDGEVLFFPPRFAHPGFYDRIIEYIHSTGARPNLREVSSLMHTMEIVTHNFGVALLPRTVARFARTGVVFKPITDKLLWIETALFMRRDPNDERVQALHDAVLAQVKRGFTD
jgi:DNA-binding transcriptional LysR family regulator